MKVIHPGSKFGIIGGGQLGRMTALSAAALGLRVYAYSDHEDSPASHVSDETFVSSYYDVDALTEFAKKVDVLTFEFENIPYESVKLLEQYVDIRPRAELLHISQNRLREKSFLNSIGVKTAEFAAVESKEDLISAVAEVGDKGILKTTELGYDGKGQFVISSKADIDAVWESFPNVQGVYEKKVPFVKEISVVIARGIDGGAMPYMPAENIHKNGILDTSIAPANVKRQIIEKAWDITHLIAEKVELVGLLAVEMFLTEDDELLVNELAPRPHNSGHWTMDACVTSQFEQFVRAVCGLPLGTADYHSSAIMKNLIGKDVHLWEELIADPDVKLHLYGKKEVRDGRKMGHYTKLSSHE
jgi:5-(carboxyamino)imidazole ribonucleotide synthase